MCGWLTGRWDIARNRGKEAERILRENCAGVTWELSVARNALLGGLVWSGEWKELAAYISDFSRDAEDRNDLNSLSLYRMNSGVVALAKDNVQQAERDLAEAQRILAEGWSRRGYHIPNFFGLFCRAQVAVYSGDGESAMNLLTQELPRIRRSFLLRMETLAVFALLLEATLAVACAADPLLSTKQTPDLLHRAQRCANAIRRKTAIWGSGLAMMIEAGTFAAQGRLDSACSRWSDAERELERSDMLMFSAACRYWRGYLLRDGGLLARPEGFFRAQEVACPQKIARMLAPGVTHV